MFLSILFRNKKGDEVEVSLHPISLVRLAAEMIEEAALVCCRKIGHADSKSAGYCERCGLSLPDDGGQLHSWLPDAYRTIRRKEDTNV